MSHEYDEKRNFFRMTVDSPMTFRIEGSDQACHGIAKDLSAIGMLFLSEQGAPVGAKVEVSMGSKDSLVPPLRARGKVLRVSTVEGNQYEIGIRIDEHL
ncbi:PilZ domain-containing protein [Endothiovibrio diazotrophicus]